MENLTVGHIEDLLRKYPKETSVNVTCGVCHHGSSGGIDILKIRDNTNQTFGYIELELNSESEGKLEVTDDEKRFYEKEIERLKEEIKEKDYILSKYKDTTQSIVSSIEYLGSMKDFYEKCIK